MPVNGDMPALLELLACPSCRSPLAGDEDLRCTGCGRTFLLDQGVPVLHGGDGVPEQPSRLGRLHYALLGNPRVYELHQAYGGGRPIAAQVKRQLEDLGGVTLLDIGAGTGMVGGLVRPETRYVWLDNDRLKLRGLLAKGLDCSAVLGDAARLPFASDAADWTVMVEVSHHLPDGALKACLEEAARVTRDRFLFVDALRGPRLRSRLLWQLDLGRFPRSEDELVGALEASFELERVERFRVNHDHLLCVCIPRRERRVSSSR
jgi:methyltransferase family protein/18S rRNA m6A1832 methyltransferase subunit Trm112p-like protein